MKKDFVISLMPLASSGDTKYDPIINAWKQAAQVLTHRQFSTTSLGDWEVSLDTSQVVEVLEAAKALEEDKDSTLFNAYTKRWFETGELVHLRLTLSGKKSAFNDEQQLLATATALLQEIFIALNMCAEGAVHLNGARCSELTNFRNLGYYGDTFESAWSQARKWGWPLLQSLNFEDTWEWLEQCEFRSCSVAHNPVHKTLVILLDIAAQPNSSEPLETILLTQALEGLLGGGGGSISAQLKKRITLILGAPESHKDWLSKFYELRSRIAHGSYPVVRNGVALDVEVADYSEKFWLPLDSARSVLLGLLQALIVNKSAGFHFEERFEFKAL
jgi:hypothetical protein